MWAFLEAIPFGTRWLIIIMSVLYLLQFLVFDQSFLGYVVINPYLICERYQFWRLLTSAFFHNGIIHIIMNMMSLYQLGVSFERTVGTFSYFIHVIVFGLVSSILYLFIAWFMKFGGRPETYYGSAVGFSGILFSLMVIDNSVSGGSRRSVLGLFLVPADIYPWIMLLLMSLLMPNVSLVGHASGLIVGYLYLMNIIKWMSPSPEFCARAERKVFCCFINCSGYISADSQREEWQPYGLFNRFGQNNEEENDQADDGHFVGTARTIGGDAPRNNTAGNQRTNRNDSPFQGQPRTIGDA
jgi:membrane associated rhomboid family serine protease